MKGKNTHQGPEKKEAGLEPAGICRLLGLKLTPQRLAILEYLDGNTAHPGAEEIYAAVAGQSIVKLYAGALVPGFILVGLYLVYVVARSLLQPSSAPRPTKDEVPDVPYG
ncbi:MAG: transcriptional repressor, partial [Nitrospiraceae bacterium]|nr:transcriptional repressor [Nitrospiraceae bacterium]